MTTTTAQLEDILIAAEAASAAWRTSAVTTRAGWLRAIGAALDEHTEELVAIAHRETRLDAVRLRGEVLRTSSQLRLFADAVEEGSFLEVIVDDADPDSTPPRPELRRFLLGVGPVAVFAASNFPFAFSVAGGDTASALAAGNPVIVKAHSGHPELSRRTAEVVVAALRTAGAPAGSFALVEGREAGNALVQHPIVQAAGFTGSVSGGRALFDLAAGRPAPIPFYGELGSINPVVITPAAASSRADELAAGLVQSFTLGVGQFCTKPGVVFIPQDSGFEDRVVAALPAASGGPLLTARITAAFPEGVRALLSDACTELIGGTLPGADEEADDIARPLIVATTAAAVAARPETLLEEVFGPLTLLVRYTDDVDLHRALLGVPGSLTATLHAEERDEVATTLDLLQRRAGRVLFSGWPTGVAVTWSQQHGGPWPATTSLHTSVGVTAIRRFLRPVVFQDAPQRLLPEPLRDAALASIPHRRNGVLVVPSTSEHAH